MTARRPRACDHTPPACIKNNQSVKKLLFFWDELKSTFWFVPIMIIILAVGVSVVAIYLDRITDIERTGIFRFIYTGSADSARNLLATISAAMIGVAGTVFSITLVTLSLAATNFGSRLLRTFMHERINQVVLGSYIATFVYSLVVLNSITENNGEEFIPALSILLAIVAAIANIILLIFFIHGIATSIQSEKIISDISSALLKNVKALYPESMGKEPENVTVPDLASLKKGYDRRETIKINESGYLQYLDTDLLFNTATEKDMLVILHFKPGDYLVKGVEVMDVFLKKGTESKDLAGFRKAFFAGKVRTPQQDVEFAIRQMVEVAIRALSTGINDPFTACSCIDNLTTSVCYLAGVKFPVRYRYDDESNLRVVARAVSFEGVMDAAFNQIRQFSGGSPSVIIRLMEAMITINKFAEHPNQKKVVRDHAEMILRLAEKSIDEPRDLEDLRKRSRIFGDMAS
jgi:uncharacterized membrane protein